MDAEKEELFKKASGFLKAVVQQVHEYRDELLVSLLEVWLSAPPKMVAENHSALTETMHVSFFTFCVLFCVPDILFLL